MKKILVIDDDLEVQAILRTYLEREGFEVFCSSCSESGLVLMRNRQPDLIILDIFLPDSNGLETCNKIRLEIKTPIILISAKGDESDKVLGLGLGADDFLTKPFSFNELVARVKAQIRRNEFVREYVPSSDEKREVIVKGPLLIDMEARTVYLREVLLTLTAKEFDLLAFFAENENRVFSKDTIYESIWGYDSGGDSRTIAVHIRRLREKIEINPNEPKMILNVWGVGYKFSASGAQ